MFEIHYSALFVAITLLWCISRACRARKTRRIDWKRELQLLLVYVCIVVIARFTFFPFSKVDGQIQPLIFDPALTWPFRINLLPFIYMGDYETKREIILNFAGNTLMFLPVGMVFPTVCKKLNTHRKALCAGFAASLAIEILQLPFFDRVSDIDDLILNTLGYAMGYGIWLAVQKRKTR